VIKTKRGLELGDVVGPCCYKGGHFHCSREDVDKYYDKQVKDFPMAGNGTFVRYATDEDKMENEHLEISAAKELQCCQDFADDMKLPMKMIAAEHLFGGERIVVYFVSETRVDFRDLVKRLAREYQTRIELRQIGSRDEARIISDYETCGQPCCCKRYLKILAPVNMRMAKVQKATLDPSKISGHCGRLKCCLRYEDDTYKELKKNLPHKNTPVDTRTGRGRVVDNQIITQLVIVQYDNGKREAVPLEDITILDPKVVAAEKKAEEKKAEAKKTVTKRPERQSRPARAAAGENKPKADSKPAKDSSGQEASDDQTGDSEAAAARKKKRNRRRRNRRKGAAKDASAQANTGDTNQAQQDKPAGLADNTTADNKPKD
jgi:cell fate regulator YaaT (PSP1 superfamily)